MAVILDGCVGIDVAEAELVMSIAGGAVSHWTNDAAGHQKLVALLRAQPPFVIVMEGSGGLEQPIAFALAEAGLDVVIANPRHVRHYAKATGRLAKTDAVDAVVLSEFAAVIPLKTRVRADTAAADLKALVGRRRQVRDAGTAERNRLRRAAAVVRPSIERQIAILTAELQTIEDEILARLALKAEWTAKRAILERVPGVAKVNAFTLIAELPELGTLSHKQIAALVGVAPGNNQSGRSDIPHPISGGRRPVRCALFQATMSAVRYNPVLRAFYQGLRDRHKPQKVAVIAAERKLLTMLNAMIRDGTLWQPATEVPQTA